MCTTQYGVWGSILALVVISSPVVASANTTLLTEVAVDAGRAKTAQTRPFTLVAGSRKWQAGPHTVATWFNTRTTDDGSTVLQLRPGPIYDYLNVHISPQVNDLGQSSRFVRVNGVLQLAGAGRKGSIVDGVKTSLAIRNALVAGKSSASVAMKEYRPSIFTAEDFKKLQFPNQLGRGETNFAGSPRNRIHNITVATKRFNGLVIMPGEEFSFNQYLGTVDAANGYLPELVIKENVTTPEYGGGICQVSTTAFRAAMQSGMDVTQRRNHSYPVRYYGAPGYDATVYAPYTDLKFRNDTGKPIHIVTNIEGTKLIFGVWGTSDGREVKINGPFTTASRPDGSVTAAIAQIVKKGGKSIREENFVSHYQSPDKFPTIKAAGE